MSFGGGGGGGGSIHASTDVALSNPTDGQVLTYNGTLAKWENATGGTSAVSSVAGKTGTVTLVPADVPGTLATSNNLSELAASASTARTNLGLGTAATQSSAAFDASGAAATAQSASLQKSSNLSDVASASTARTNLGLGTAATISSTAGGDLSGTLPSPTVAKVNGVAITGTPSANQIVTASGSTAASWVTLLDYSNVPAGSNISVDYNSGSSSYPSRPTARTDIVVIWRGPTQPPAMLSGDEWKVTS